MSNQAVGNVYQTIIEEVVSSSRVDFEENGVEESVLEELRLGWQQKLSQLDVAQFPWDPKPETAAPAAAASQAPPASATPVHSQPTFSPNPPQPANGAVQDGAKQDAGFKEEADAKVKLEPGLPANMAFNSIDDKNTVAASRAAHHLQQQYGNRATGSINAIQDNIGQQPAGQQPLSQSMEDSQSATQGQHASLQNAQTDGASGDAEEFEAVLMRRGEAGELEELGRVEIDNLLHQHIAANAKSMEGGGLMLPLKEATKHKSLSHGSRKGKGVAAHDGGDDDENDEDAINSDLDDTDEGGSDEEPDDEGLGHIMLCMYDKVQRVKNKW